MDHDYIQILLSLVAAPRVAHCPLIPRVQEVSEKLRWHIDEVTFRCTDDSMHDAIRESYATASGGEVK